MADLKQLYIYTDGSCLGNPGQGGYGVVMRFLQHSKELSQGYRLTTNNRMELLAPIMALEALYDPCAIIITSDSEYVRQGITKWIFGWKKRNWKTSTGENVKNKDLWLRLDNAIKPHKIEWKWVKGHSGHSENERCDEIARIAADGSDLLEDTGYQAN